MHKLGFSDPRNEGRKQTVLFEDGEEILGVQLEYGEFYVFGITRVKWRPSVVSHTMRP